VIKASGIIENCSWRSIQKIIGVSECNGNQFVFGSRRWRCSRVGEEV